MLEETSPQQNIRVALTGAGSMGKGIAGQIFATKGMELAWVMDIDSEAAATAAQLGHCRHYGTDFEQLLSDHPVDVLVEATNSIGPAAEYCLAALDADAHIVLMNAEVDLALAPLLQYEAKQRNLIVTSDAGDQHGVLASLIEEAGAMGFDIVQAGNIKGFLDRYATPESIRHEAEIRKLSATQCCAYTDGTKLHIEMAVLANALGYLPPEGGMTGPRAENVHEALGLFDFDSYGQTARIDYLLGAEPGGGVYLVVRPKKELPPEQKFYLSYYKLGDGPYYILYRPYHLCHLETPKAIVAAFRGDALLTTSRKSCDVYAYAKQDLAAGTSIKHAIGSTEVYGLVEPLDHHKIPIALLEESTILRTSLCKDESLTIEHLDLPDNKLTKLWRQQQDLLSQ